ncbi:MAG TPA: hypothetical protein VGT60_04210 [Candidatus Limnocylindria bacterium]|nr:hypothetical protein [Candidatus Limnocylindria bacterium]
MRKATTLFTILASILFYAFAVAAPASADPGGNNGDVKIHDTGTAVDDHRNEPHVCRFYIDGFNFDGGSSGSWRIEGWAPTGSGVKASGSWGPADSTGAWRSAPLTLADGHYKLFVKQTGAPGGEKQKVFWVECGGKTAGGTEEHGTTNAGGQTCTGVAALEEHSDILGATQGGIAMVNFKMSSGCAGKELTLVSYTAPSAEFTRETASQQQLFEAKTGTFNNGSFTLSVHVPSCFFQVDFVYGTPITQFGGSSFYSDQGRLIMGVNGGTTECATTTSNGGSGSTEVTPRANSGTENNGSGTTGTAPSTGNAVLGFQTPPSNTAVGAVTPVVELPGGSNQQAPNTGVNGIQTSPVAGVQGLPSTSTDSTPTMPLAALGLAFLALGGVLLRRHDTRI